MLVFIDESGCPGFKLDKGSSPLFVAAMVVFHGEGQASVAETAIQQVREDCNHKPEFKFSKCRNTVRDAFCQSLAGHDFVIRAIVVNKQRVHSSILRGVTESFYSYFVKLMMQHDNQLLTDAIVKIDESGDRKFKKELATYLQRELGGRIKKVRCVNSRSSPLVQLADMAAGAIHRAYRDDQKKSDRWRYVLRRRIQDIWIFPNPGH